MQFDCILRYLLIYSRVYDEDGSGTVDREEMVEIVSNMYTSQGVAMVNIIHTKGIAAKIRAA